MATTTDTDTLLESLFEDLRAQMNALNDLHHPVYPSNPKRVAELEARIAELKAAITARKSALRAAK